MLHWLRTNPDALWIVYFASLAGWLAVAILLRPPSWVPLSVGMAPVVFLASLAHMGHWRLAVQEPPVGIALCLAGMNGFGEALKLTWPTLGTWTILSIQIAGALLVLLILRLVRPSSAGATQ